MVAPPWVGRYGRTFSTSSDARAAASAGPRNLSHSELARTGPVVMPPPPTPDLSEPLTSPSRWREIPASRRLPPHAQRDADACPGHPAVAQFAHAIAKSCFDIRRRYGRDPFQQLVLPHQGPLGS